MSRRVEAGPGDTFTFRKRGGYGAVQVLAERHDRKRPLLQLFNLPLLSPEPVTAAEIEALVLEESHLGPRRYLWVDSRVPWWASLIEGVTRRFPVPAQMPDAYGGFGSFAYGSYPPPPPEIYGPPVDNWRHDPEIIAIDLGAGGRVETRRDSRILDLRPLCAGDGDGADWSKLDVLPHLGDITHIGPDRGLSAKLDRHPTIRKLIWYGPHPSVIDLRATFLSRVNLSGIVGPIHLLLPPCVEDVVLGGAVGQVTIETRPLDHRFKLTLWPPEGSALPQGIPDLQALGIFGAEHFDLAAMADAWPGLTGLVWRNLTIRHADALARLPHLRDIGGYEIYGLDVEHFPALADMKQLESLSIDGLRADDKAVLARKLKGLHHLELRRAKSAEWLAKNVDNPFKRWEEDSKPFGKAAMALWNAALGQAKAAERPVTAEAAGAILAWMVAELNRLDGKYAAIDTLRREEAYEAILKLGADYLDGVLSEEKIGEIVDRDRDW